MSGNWLPWPGAEDDREATARHKGLMPKADKVKLDAYPDFADLEPANPVRARVFRSTNQSIATSTVTAITFDTVRVNNSGYTGGAAPWVVGSATRLTVPTGGAGFYAIGAGVLWASATGGNRRLVQLRINGTTVIAADEKTSGSYFPTHAFATRYQLADASYVELLVFQDSGAALNVTAAGNYSAELWFQREAD